MCIRDSTYCWGYQYSYDAWGNLLSQAGWTPTYNGCTETTMGTVTADGNNHISAMSYDASGNTLGDGNFTYTWDGESQMKTAAGVTYAYDGDGRRVAKVGSKLYCCLLYTSIPCRGFHWPIIPMAALTRSPGRKPAFLSRRL